MTDVEHRLRRFHARHAGASARVFGGARGPDGRDSYARLADGVRPGERMLDLACGDGSLLRRIRDRVAGVQLVGVDMSDDELAVARGRVPEAELHLARAQQLPLGDGSVDRVVSHMALMLMDPIEPVIAELSRVTRRGGALSFVVGGPFERTGAQVAFFSALRARMSDALRTATYGDPRMESAEGIRELLSAWRDVEIAELAFDIDVAPDDLWEFVERAYYPVDALPEADKDALRAELSAHPEVYAPDGAARWRFGMRHVGAVR